MNISNYISFEENIAIISGIVLNLSEDIKISFEKNKIHAHTIKTREKSRAKFLFKLKSNSPIHFLIHSRFHQHCYTI